MTKQGYGILAIEPGGIADAAGISPGYRLLAINGEPVGDALDLRFYESDEVLELELLTPGGERDCVYVEKAPDETLGIVGEPLRCRSCGNHCIFCFADQNPPGSRPELSFRDEDFRFSFLHGQYVTLTHLSDAEKDRIIRQHLFPLYISIHSTDEHVRRRLTGVRRSRPVLPLMREFARHGGTFHGQIVVCPGWNDGDDLRRSIGELKTLRPNLLSLAVVPVGLTDHRAGLPDISHGGPQWAASLVAIRNDMKASDDPGWLCVADECYLRARLPIPSAEEYGDYDQLENGVGMIRNFLDAAGELHASQALPHGRSDEWVIVTGEAFAPFLRRTVTGWLSETAARTQHAMVRVVPVPNRRFGRWINVAGLVTGEDIADTLAGIPGSGPVIVPDIMLRHGEDLFLDDMTVRSLENRISRPVIPVDPSPESLYKLLLLSDGVGFRQETGG